MTQLFYIALHPQVGIVRDPETGVGRVLRHDNGEPVIERYVPKHTKRLYEDLSIARRESNAYAGRRNPSGFGRVIPIDLDDMLHVDATVHEQWQHAERQLFRWTIEEARLRPADRGEPVLPSLGDIHAIRDGALRWMGSWSRFSTWPEQSNQREPYEALVKVWPDLADDQRKKAKP